MAVSCCAAKETLFEAVLDGARWMEFLQATSRCLRASSAFIMSTAPSVDHRPACELGLAHGTIRRYYEYFHHVDTWWARVPPPAPGRARLVREGGRSGWRRYDHRWRRHQGRARGR